MDTTEAITHVSLCAGYGGIDLGLKRAVPNLRTIAFSEIEAFACANLVGKMEAGLLDAAPIWTDLKTFPWDAFHGKVHVLSGGYPCQPFSAAGLRKGADDPRHLWPFIADGIRRMQPELCFFENVEGHVSLGLREVIGELESLGYRTTWGLFSAAEVGAPHQRKRVFIMAHRNDAGLEGYGRYVAVNGAKGWEDEVGHTWPSRPGQPQFAWEPPRVVGLAHASSQRGGSKSGDAVHQERTASEARSTSLSQDAQRQNGASIANHQSAGNDAGLANAQRGRGEESGVQRADLPSESSGRDSQGMGNASHSGHARAKRQGSSGSQGQSDGHAAQSTGRTAQPSLGLHSDECPSVLGRTLTLNPYGHNGLLDDYLSQKIRAREVLFEVWNEARSKAIQWTPGGLQRLLEEKILLSGMQLDKFTQRICFFVWCVQTSNQAQGWGLQGMWLYESSGSPSQGQEPIEQFKRELGYAMCQLSYEIALAGGQGSVETESILQGVRSASERAWALSETLPEMEEVWRSSLDQTIWEKGCFVQATSKGNRTDELRLLGNGVVPATAERAFRVLAGRLFQ